LRPLLFSDLLRRHVSAFLVILSESFRSRRASPFLKRSILGKGFQTVWTLLLGTRASVALLLVSFLLASVICARLLACYSWETQVFGLLSLLLSCREDLRHSGEQTGVQFLALVPCPSELLPRDNSRNNIPALGWHFTSMVSSP